jgi:hypothetical protein
MMERFWKKVDKTDDCWNWVGSISNHGYGRININKKVCFAHRVAYEMSVGEIPEGLVIDHLCRNPRCVNPRHLEPVSQGENIRRGSSQEMRTLKYRSRTHCKHGHEWTDETTSYRGTRRDCKICIKLRNENWRKKQ